MNGIAISCDLQWDKFFKASLKTPVLLLMLYNVLCINWTDSHLSNNTQQVFKRPSLEHAVVLLCHIFVVQRDNEEHFQKRTGRVMCGTVSGLRCI